MTAIEVDRLRRTLPDDDDHPYRSGAWRPQATEWRVDDVEVVEGAIPDDLEGLYVRNTENPLHEPISLYHPFDGDGMVHAIRFRGGTASYRNRFVRTVGLEAEQEAGASLWAGLAENPRHAVRTDGRTARGAMKDASSTDVVVHAGELVTSSGQVLGRHDGITGFTVGQRKGLGVASPSPLYVLNIDPASHRVTVGADEELATHHLRAGDLNWISIPALTSPMRVQIKIRHRHEPAGATLEPDPEAPAERVVALFDQPQRAVTPGQSAVFYNGDEVVGGGWIR